MYKHFFKRLIDIVLSFIGIIVLAVPMLLIAMIIKIDSPGPVLFKQKRIGIHKSTFTILKFRSMPISAPHDTPTHQLQNAEEMLSRWQRLMRRASIDELPQIFNIFVGQMSIIGPRPALWNQDDLVAERDKYGANEVKPGLTGWAQINGRDELEIPVKAQLDGEYVRRMSFGFDYSLGEWIRSQREKKRDGTLEKDKEERLNAIGMDWLSNQAREWETHFESCRRYYEKYGNLNMTTSYVSDDGFQLGLWLWRIRTGKMKLKTTGENGNQIARLESIGIVWREDAVPMKNNISISDLPGNNESRSIAI